MSSRDSSTEDPAQVSENASLNGHRILLVEDSPVVGPFTADMLIDLGYEVIGPAPNMAAAREMIDGERFDAAIMDIHIRGERVFPLCEALEEKDLPFVLTSGYADWSMPDKWQDRPRLQKPYTLDDVRGALGELLEA